MKIYYLFCLLRNDEAGENLMMALPRTAQSFYTSNIQPIIIINNFGTPLPLSNPTTTSWLQTILDFSKTALQLATIVKAVVPLTETWQIKEDSRIDF